MRRYIVLAAIAVVAAALAFVVWRDPASNERTNPRTKWSSATEGFFADYVDADGRVVRHDQGGDTVSEGQSYAMQLALGEGDAARFQLTWAWTKTHLQRDDGLISWRWTNGHVADKESAADADVDIAVALLRGATAFDRPEYRDEARRLAEAIVDHETFSAGGRMLLAAGPWAVSERIINPSYLAPCDYSELLSATGDQRWQQLHDGSLSVLHDTLERGLPPDWTLVQPDGTLRPITSPDDRSGAGRYGLDAARVSVRLATCDDGHALSEALWPRLRALDGQGAGVAYSLDGRRLDHDTNPLGLIAAALAARSSSDGPDASQLLAEAANLQTEHSTYYGAAWLALGQQLLDGSNGQGNAIGRSKSLRLIKADARVPAQVPPSTTTPPITEPSPTTTELPSSTTTENSATTTAPPPTTVSSPASVPPTAAPPGVTAPVATTAVPTTEAGSPIGTVDPTETSEADSTAATDATPASEQPPRENSGSAADDLTASPSQLDPVLPGQHNTRVSPQSRAERSRRRTGGITIVGFAGIASMGAALGLRERRILRARSLQNVGG